MRLARATKASETNPSIRRRACARHASRVSLLPPEVQLGVDGELAVRFSHLEPLYELVGKPSTRNWRHTKRRRARSQLTNPRSSGTSPFGFFSWGWWVDLFRTSRNR